jgi:hypothetical protein
MQNRVVRFTAYAVISGLHDHMLRAFPITSLVARTFRWQCSDLFRTQRMLIKADHRSVMFISELMIQITCKNRGKLNNIENPPHRYVKFKPETDWPCPRSGC